MKRHWLSLLLLYANQVNVKIENDMRMGKISYSISLGTSNGMVDAGNPSIKSSMKKPAKNTTIMMASNLKMYFIFALFPGLSDLPGIASPAYPKIL